MIKQDKYVPALNSLSTEAEIYKQKLAESSPYLQQPELQDSDKKSPLLSSTTPEDTQVPVIQPLNLDGIRSQQQFYDAMWVTLGDLNGWLETMESALNHLNINPSSS
jgi:hypothetical protein